MVDGRLPTSLYVDAVLRPLNDRGVFYYITQKGNHDSGVILLKLNSLDGQCALLTQQRDLDGVLGWVDVMPESIIEESVADMYIQKARAQDPDLWVIEIEDPARVNPFAE